LCSWVLLCLVSPRKRPNTRQLARSFDLKMVRFMLYFFLSKNVKKKWEKLFLARIKMKLSFVAVCEERYILIWNFLHCQYLNYQTTKCYLRFWKISSEIGPFFKDNLLPVNIRAREFVTVSVCLCCFTVMCCAALTLMPSAVLKVIVDVLSSSDGVYQTSSIKVYSLWSSSR